MPIIAPVMRLLDSLVITCCVVKTSDSSYFRIKPASPTEYSAYVREWKTAMKEAHESAANRSRLSGMKGKKHYERMGHSPVLRPGDRFSKKCT